MTARGHAEEASRLLRPKPAPSAAYVARAQAHAQTAIALALTGDSDGSGSPADKLGWALDRAASAIENAADRVGR